MMMIAGRSPSRVAKPSLHPSREQHRNAQDVPIVPKPARHASLQTKTPLLVFACAQCARGAPAPVVGSRRKACRSGRDPCAAGCGKSRGRGKKRPQSRRTEGLPAVPSDGAFFAGSTAGSGSGTTCDQRRRSSAVHSPRQKVELQPSASAPLLPTPVCGLAARPAVLPASAGLTGRWSPRWRPAASRSCSVWRAGSRGSSSAPTCSPASRSSRPSCSASTSPARWSC